MGGCGSRADADALARDALLTKQNYDDFVRRQQRIKLLLLGPGESGKSTLFKQMKLIYGVGFTPEDIDNFTLVVHHNVMTSVRSLVQACEDMEFDITCMDEVDQFRDMSDQTIVDRDIAVILKTIWDDPAVQRAFSVRHRFQLNDSAAYYLSSLDRISEPGYKATEQDIMRSRTRTSGIVQEAYLIDDVPFEIYDVGGQRNERRKWIHCFDDVTAVIFVAALSEYDQVLYEDASQNRLLEAINLFDEICNSRWFEHTSIILFLNKMDVFAEKIRAKDLRQPNPTPGLPDLFEDYTGGTDHLAAIAYISERFKSRNGIPDRREVFIKVTCATDKSNVKTVFNSCKAIILKQNMQGSGFME